ncbi:hypothetical protein EVAR_87179_1 [Eumeta japonica]|uniref:115 kDa protein in type-1 retrotransposable element R1DM n=1 Tax=Eumeta variegata TaxID=151549 RepID=A0A4C1VU33_EUMVA|nr:hypothetical protein EVAR_87179_1 [Eumeta japonica]
MELQRRPVRDQSPLVQCSRCLGFGHSRKYCREEADKRAHCGDNHTGPLCQAWKTARPPSTDKSRLLLATDATDTRNRIHTADGLSTEKNTDHAFLRFVQSNLQRSKLTTSELLVEADKRKIAVALVQEPYVGNIGELRRYSGGRLIQRMALHMGLVKAAIIILDSDINVEEDQTFIDENVTAAVIKAVRRRQAYLPIPRPR